MIRIRQCKDDCCVVRIPSKRFWFIEAPGSKDTVTSFGQAVLIADEYAKLGVPS
jgi:hypothetical protein